MLRSRGSGASGHACVSTQRPSTETRNPFPTASTRYSPSGNSTAVVATRGDGQALVAFVTLKAGVAPSPELRHELAEHVGNEIGKFARPDSVRFADAVPKTRSGKIMRRLLAELAAGKEPAGDTTTLEDISVLARLRDDE